MNKRQIKYILSFILVLALAGFGACEGPIGPEGPQGPQGEQGPPGPVGPAGADGSIIHAGHEAPVESLGKPGDFYLDLSNGYLYGPKMTEGWGAPFSLVGEDGPEGPQGPEGPEGPQGPPGEDGQDGRDGKDGEDGKDGQDGEDGKDGQDGKDGGQIYAGNGVPDNSLGKKGDYYLDKDNYDLYGPKTGSGWGAPINLQGPRGDKGDQGPQGPPGEDGNANVTLYIFPPHDFSVDASATSSEGLYIAGISAFDVAYSTWLIYLQYFSGSDVGYYSMPGYGFSENSLYSSLHWFDDDQASIKFEVQLDEGPGEAYNGIHVFRIESSAVEDCTDGTGCKLTNTGSIIPSDLDLSDYQAVMDYYGLTEEDAVRVYSP